MSSYGQNWLKACHKSFWTLLLAFSGMVSKAMLAFMQIFTLFLDAAWRLVTFI